MVELPFPLVMPTAWAAGGAARAERQEQEGGACYLLPERTHPLFYRTASGAEINLLLERPDGCLWAIEIKRALTAKPRRGFHVACEDIKPARAFVVYAGEERYPVAEGVEAIGVRELAELVAGA